MKKIKIGLLARIVIAIILGIAIGTFFPAPLVRIFVTFNGIFSEFLNFSIPLIILGLVAVAIADIGKGAGKMLLITALIAYGATFKASLFSEASPNPRVKARIKAVITFINGGMDTER